MLQFHLTKLLQNAVAQLNSPICSQGTKPVSFRICLIRKSGHKTWNTVLLSYFQFSLEKKIVTLQVDALRMRGLLFLVQYFFFFFIGRYNLFLRLLLARCQKEFRPHLFAAVFRINVVKKRNRKLSLFHPLLIILPLLYKFSIKILNDRA